MDGTEAHDTYYVYDSYGNLRAVLPPMAADGLNAGIWNESDPYLEQYAYLYKYDSRNRQIAKKLPGAGWVYYVYDKADRLIFSQDSEQRARGEWSFNIPDALDRTALTGTCANSLDYTEQLSNAVRANWENTTTQYKGYSIDPDILELVNPRLLTVNFYDSYEFMGKNEIPAGNHSDYKYDGLQGYAGRYPDSFKGLNTGILTALLDESEHPTFALSVIYYDYRGRPAQVNSGKDLTKEYYCYTFSGQVKHKKTMRFKDKKASITEYHTYTYDHADRLIKTEHQVGHNNYLADKITMAEYTYDNLGRLETKDLHGNGMNPLAYAYNIRGWLSGTDSRLFSQNLYYNTGEGDARYNGNISSMTWKAGNESTLRGYKFLYDGLNRLTDANYGEGINIAGNLNRFTEKVSDYDKHGNIIALQRYGKTASSSYGLIDDLSFGYTGNRMMSVNDAIAATSVGQSFHFDDRGSKTDNEFTYDGNGNLVTDNNKNITHIQYNMLNLPERVQLSDSREAVYTYDAAGVKHKVAYYKDGVKEKDTEYCGNVIYENWMLDKVLTEDGYITFTHDGIPTYHYYLKDHLGNNRVVMNQDGTIEQVNHYYPFGGLFDQTAEDLQAYKYNGKELDRTYGLDLYDYSARYMDGAIGRFTTMDPMAEKYYAISPYVYCNNNPVRFVDPTGMVYVIWYTDDKGKQRSFIFNGENADSAPKNDFVNNVITAYNYNTENGGGKNMQEIATAKDYKVAVMETPFGSEYKGQYKTVYFNPFAALKLEDGHVLSPATILEHEMTHATDHKNGTKDIRKDEDYGFMYEKNIILGSELETAKANGELPKNHRGRRSHGGSTRIITKGVTSTKEDSSQKSADFRKRIQTGNQNSIKTFSSESF